MSSNNIHVDAGESLSASATIPKETSKGNMADGAPTDTTACRELSPITRQPLEEGQHTDTQRTHTDARTEPGPSRKPVTLKKGKRTGKSSPPKGVMETGRTWALVQSAKKKTKTGGLRRIAVTKSAQMAARRVQIDDARKLEDVSLLDATIQEPPKPEMRKPLPPQTIVLPPTAVIPTPKQENYFIVRSNTPLREEESPRDQVPAPEITSQEEMRESDAWETEESETEFSEAESDAFKTTGRESILPPIGSHTGVCKDMATQKAREWLHMGKDALESSKTLKRELRATAVECMSNLYELILSLAESRNRHRLSLEMEKTQTAKAKERAVREKLRMQTTHTKAIMDLEEKHREQMKELHSSLQGTQTSIAGVQSWLNFEMDGIITKSVETVHLKAGKQQTGAPSTSKTRRPTTTWPRRVPVRRHRANTARLESSIADLKSTVGSITTEIHYLRQDIGGAEAKRASSPRSPVPVERDDTSYTQLREELIGMRQELERMLQDCRKSKPASREEIGEEIREATAPLMTKARQIQDGLEEVRDVVLSNPVPSTGVTQGLGTELAAADTAAQIEGLLHPIRADVAEMASTSRELNKTMEWYNSALQKQNQGAFSKLSQQGRTYASVVKTAPPKNPKHTLIISCTDPALTGEKVMETITETLDFKNTGVTVDRVRKARNSKILLSCEDRENADKIKRKISDNKNLKVHEAKPLNPLVRIKNVMAYHKDEDLVEHLKAQNRKLFADLPGDQTSIRVRYRKRARNPKQCHAVLEVAPTLHKRMIEAGTVHIALNRREVEDQSPLVQCAKCLGFGHTKALCKETHQYCNYCSGAHPWQECIARQEDRPPKCKNCKDSRAQDVFPHMAFSDECPERIAWDGLARSKIAYC